MVHDICAVTRDGICVLGGVDVRPGDLRITGIVLSPFESVEMAEPELGSDADAEWLRSHS